MESCNFPSGFLKEKWKKRVVNLSERTGDHELQLALRWGERWIRIDRSGFPQV